MAKDLVMTFITEGGEKSNLTVKNVKENLEKDAISTLMDTIITKNIFESKHGAFVQKNSASIVETTKQKIELTDN